ncbi:MAG: deoxynucleoside kinase [Proteobacteria bacterium]|nr:deoxynucleoside kinase [Pseudomonadota bacterium]MBU4294679.1 deoxynucleoside kinase [Pseudomonadota bacterium]MCG2748591.1 deoxynucleoside kinase [Desulfobulbaceae bacterium]
MTTTEELVLMDPWESEVDVPDSKDSLYICVSGNSGAGKSSLLKQIWGEIFRKDKYSIAIDEKSLHHPFLLSLFHDTGRYGFQIQLNFMLQRTLLVKRWLDLGYNVIMERSHLEDTVFIEHLHNKGHVSDSEYRTYLDLWQCLAKQVRVPDIIVFLDVPPEVSLARIRNDEKSGRRLCEFPDEATKETWINSWYQLYIRRFRELKELPDIPTRIIELQATDSTASILHMIFPDCEL